MIMADGDQVVTSLSDIKAMSKIAVKESSSEFDETKPKAKVPSYDRNGTWSSYNTMLKLAILPKNSQLASKESPTYADIISFYVCHSVLVIIYLFMFIFRQYEFISNKVKLRFLNLTYNPSKSPSLIGNDISKLAKIPRRVAAILNYRLEEEENGGIDGLLNDSSELASWCISSGIPTLSIYERTGVMKKHVPELRRAIYKKLAVYFGRGNVPNYTIKIPHLNLSYQGASDEVLLAGKPAIEISLLSLIDGKNTIVEMTRVMADLTKNNELSEKKINIKFIDDELRHLVGIEPDLIIMFQPYLDLQGFPPWHIRLSEMYWEPDNDEVTYSVFLRALQKYSTCKVNVGK